MLSYWLRSKKLTEIKYTRVIKITTGRIMLLSKCAVYESKKSRFIKEQEASELLSNLGIKIPLNEIPVLGPLFLKV